MEMIEFKGLFALTQALTNMSVKKGGVIPSRRQKPGKEKKKDIKRTCNTRKQKDMQDLTLQRNKSWLLKWVSKKPTNFSARNTQDFKATDISKREGGWATK